MSKLIKDEFYSNLIPAPMRYAVLLPDDYKKVKEIEVLRNSFGNPMSLWVSNIPPAK
jgi:hypothetical protein